MYTSSPLLSGYCTRENIDRIKGSPFASVHGNRVISIYDNTNFRAIWYGTNKIFMNAVFLGRLWEEQEQNRCWLLVIFSFPKELKLPGKE